MQIFFRDAAAAFVVFDLTRRATFEAVRRWKEDLDSKVVTSDGAKVGHDVIGVTVDSNFTFSIPQIPTILLANKSDLTEARSVSDDEVYQLYSAVYSVQYSVQVYRLSQELGFTSWYSVSARDGDNVDTAGDMIVAHVLQRELGLGTAGDKMERLLRFPERGVIVRDHNGAAVKRKKKCC